MSNTSASKPYTSLQVTSWTRTTVAAAACTFVIGIALFFLTTPGVAQCGSFGSFMGATTVLLGMTLYARLKHYKDSHQFAKVIAFASVIALIGLEITLINQLAGSRNLYCTLAGVAITVLALPVALVNCVRSRNHDTQARQTRFYEMLLQMKEKNDGRRAEELLKGPEMRSEILKWYGEEAARILNLTPEERAYAQKVIAKDSRLSKAFGLAAYLRNGVEDSTYEKHPLVSEIESFKSLINRDQHPRAKNLGALHKHILYKKTSLLWSLCICGEFELAKKVIEALYQDEFPPRERDAILGTFRNPTEDHHTSVVSYNLMLEMFAPRHNTPTHSKWEVKELITREAEHASPEFAEALLQLAVRYKLDDLDLPVKVQEELLTRSLKRDIPAKQKLEDLLKYNVRFHRAVEVVLEKQLNLPKAEFIAFMEEGNALLLMKLLKLHDIELLEEIPATLMTLFFEEVDKGGGSLGERVEKVLQEYGQNREILLSLSDYIKQKVNTREEAQAILQLFSKYEVAESALNPEALRELIQKASLHNSSVQAFTDVLGLRSQFPNATKEVILYFSRLADVGMESKDAKELLELFIAKQVRENELVPHCIKTLTLLSTNGQPLKNRLYYRLDLLPHFPIAIDKLIRSFIDEHTDQVAELLAGYPQLDKLLASCSSEVLSKLLPLAINSKHEKFRNAVVLAIVKSSDIELQKNLIQHVYASKDNSLKGLLGIYLRTNRSFLNAYLTYNYVDPTPALGMFKPNTLNSLSEKSLNNLLQFSLKANNMGIAKEVIPFMIKQRMKINDFLRAQIGKRPEFNDVFPEAMRPPV